MVACAPNAPIVQPTETHWRFAKTTIGLKRMNMTILNVHLPALRVRRKTTAVALTARANVTTEALVSPTTNVLWGLVNPRRVVPNRDTVQGYVNAIDRDIMDRFANVRRGLMG